MVEKYGNPTTQKERGKAQIERIEGKSPEGKDIKFELNEQLNYWGKFYQNHKIDWIELPKKIKVGEEQVKEMKRLIEKLGFDKMIIIPENLANTGEKYKKLYELMSKGWEKDLSLNFKEDVGLGFEKLKNKSDKLRIILTKETQDLKDNELFKQTLGNSADDLEESSGIFRKYGVRGIDAEIYLVWQREYHEKTGKYLEEESWTWLTEQVRPESGRVPTSFGGALLDFSAYPPDLREDFLGCRLARSFEVT